MKKAIPDSDRKGCFCCNGDHHQPKRPAVIMQKDVISDF